MGSFDGPGCDRNRIDPPREIFQKERKRNKGNPVLFSQQDFDIEGRISRYKSSDVLEFDPVAVEKVFGKDDNENSPVEGTMLYEVSFPVVGLDDDGIEESGFIPRVPEMICDFLDPFVFGRIGNDESAAHSVPIRFALRDIEGESIVMKNVVCREIERAGLFANPIFLHEQDLGRIGPGRYRPESDAKEKNEHDGCNRFCNKGNPAMERSEHVESSESESHVVWCAKTDGQIIAEYELQSESRKARDFDIVLISHESSMLAMDGPFCQNPPSSQWGSFSPEKYQYCFYRESWEWTGMGEPMRSS